MLFLSLSTNGIDFKKMCICFISQVDTEFFEVIAFR